MPKSVPDVQVTYESKPEETLEQQPADISFAQKVENYKPQQEQPAQEVDAEQRYMSAKAAFIVVNDEHNAAVIDGHKPDNNQYIDAYIEFAHAARDLAQQNPEKMQQEIKELHSIELNQMDTYVNEGLNASRTEEQREEVAPEAPTQDKAITEDPVQKEISENQISNTVESKPEQEQTKAPNQEWEPGASYSENFQKAYANLVADPDNVLKKNEFNNAFVREVKSDNREQVKADIDAISPHLYNRQLKETQKELQLDKSSQTPNKNLSEHSRVQNKNPY